MHITSGLNSRYKVNSLFPTRIAELKSEYFKGCILFGVCFTDSL